MSSGFISESVIEERKKLRQQEWEKVRRPDQPLQAPEEEYDSRSLFDRLQEQKQKRDQEYEEAHKLKNMIKGLDDDEVEFLDLVDRTKMEEEKRKYQEEAKEMQDFRKAVATLNEQSLQDRIKIEVKKAEVKKASSSVDLSIGVKKNSQLKLLAGAVKKRPAEQANGNPEKKKKTEDEDVNNHVSENPDNQEMKESNHEETSAPSDPQKVSESSKADAEVSVDHDPAPTGLQCIGILPGIGGYSNSSDSERSSDTDEELQGQQQNFDLCGRRLVLVAKKNKASES